MRKLCSVLMLGVVQLIAQNVVYLPGDPRYKTPSRDTTLQASSTMFVFTMKKPAQYDLPRDIQRMIMNCFRDAPAPQVLVWREEYNVVCEAKEDVRAWLDEVLVHRMRLLREDIDRTTSVPLKDSLQREMKYTSEWREFNLKDW